MSVSKNNQLLSADKELNELSNIKEFINPVLLECKVLKEPFYMNVRYY